MSNSTCSVLNLKFIAFFDRAGIEKGPCFTLLGWPLLFFCIIFVNVIQYAWCIMVYIQGVKVTEGLPMIYLLYELISIVDMACRVQCIQESCCLAGKTSHVPVCSKWKAGLCLNISVLHNLSCQQKLISFSLQVKAANKLLKSIPQRSRRKKLAGVPVFSAQNLNIAVATNDGIRWYWLDSWFFLWSFPHSFFTSYFTSMQPFCPVHVMFDVHLFPWAEIIDYPTM